MAIRALIIDDDPTRAFPLLRAGVDVRIAHGWEQVRFWLQDAARYWTPQIVFLDHDMPLMDGHAVCDLFGTEFVHLPIVIWSNNPVGRENMRRILRSQAEVLGIEPRIWVRGYGAAQDRYADVLEVVKDL